MVVLIPFLPFVFGFIAMGKSGRIAAIHERQKAAGTTRRSSDIETSEPCSSCGAGNPVDGQHASRVDWEKGLSRFWPTLTRNWAHT